MLPATVNGRIAVGVGGLIVAFAVWAGGAQTSGPSARQHIIVIGLERAANSTLPLASVHATHDGHLRSLGWTQTISGSPGGKFRVAVLVDGVTACFLDVACDAAAPQDYATDCDAVFVVTEDVDVKITDTTCTDTIPTGFPSLTYE